MKLLHTADWHIGKRVNGYDMLADQAYCLHRMCDQIADQNIDAAIIVGDLYDRVNPSQDSLALANDIMVRLVEELGIPLLVIAGNHDSPQLLDYGRPLLSKEQLYVAGTLKEDWTPVSIGPADFWLVPFSEVEVAQDFYGQEGWTTFADMAAYQIQHIQQHWDPSRLNILIYHGYVIHQTAESVEDSESERPLAIGTAEYIPVDVFEDFDYVALGHLHKAQQVKSDRVRYSGSPIKYSKSEAHHLKSYTLVDLTDQSIDIQAIPFAQRKDLKVLRGYFDDLLQDSSDDYVFIDLLDDHYHIQAMDRLQSAYPYLMGVSYVNRTISLKDDRLFTKEDVEKKDVVDLFEDFYNHCHGRTLTNKQKEKLTLLYQQLLKEVD